MVVKERAVVRHEDNGSRKGCEAIVEPRRCVQVEVVRGLVEEDVGALANASSSASFVCSPPLRLPTGSSGAIDRSCARPRSSRVR